MSICEREEVPVALGANGLPLGEGSQSRVFGSCACWPGGSKSQHVVMKGGATRCGCCKTRPMF